MTIIYIADCLKKPSGNSLKELIVKSLTEKRQKNN